MEKTKENYLVWLNSKNQQIQNKAFMSALRENLERDKPFDFYELLSVNPKLILRNVSVLLKQKPCLLFGLRPFMLLREQIPRRFVPAHRRLSPDKSSFYGLKNFFNDGRTARRFAAAD